MLGPKLNPCSHKTMCWLCL